jgi:uncharacterized protein involved in exopolysaccharide biosynthesis
MGPSPVPSGEFTLLDLATVLFRHRRLVVGLPIAVALVIAGISLLMPPSFTATTSFVPEASSTSRLPGGLAGIAGIAGQLGLSVGGDASRSPRFYADVLKSRELLEHVLQSRYADPREGRSADSTRLLDILEIRGRDSSDRLSRGVRVLSNLVATSVDNQTGMVRLSVESRYPNLAAGTANRFIDLLNDFNAQKRQSQARERRKFVEQRIAAAEQELRAAEQEWRVFYERNRSWQQSPQLVSEEGRLRRQVDLRQEVYLTLKREYETARIEEVNDTPVITVIDPAVAPQVRSRPRRTVMVLFGFVLGAIVGVFGALGAEYVDRLRGQAVLPRSPRR